MARQQKLPATRAPASQVEVQVPQLSVPLQGAHLNVVRGPEGRRLLTVGPVLVTFTMPFDEENARALARELAGGVEIASSLDLPREPML